MRLLVTGSSGFIGTNLVEKSFHIGIHILGVDRVEPQHGGHEKFFRRINILDQEGLHRVFSDFSPTHVVHLAARTDLHESRCIEGYESNTKGVENLICAINRQRTMVRSIFVSTKLVFPTDYVPKGDEDFCPDTLYGESKAIGEKILKNSKLECGWCIVRPTSIWGPWSIAPHIPYGRFFRMIASGCYYHPGQCDPPKSFGYVGNTVYQILKLLDAPVEQINGQVFYLSDYEVFTIKEWADMISGHLRGRKVGTIPEPVVKLLAMTGDVLKFLGMKEPPFSSFRLKNMRADTSNVPLENIKQISGPLPYTIEQGVEKTIEWMRNYGYIH